MENQIVDHLAQAMVVTFVKALEDESQLVDAVAARVAGEIGQEAVPALIQALKDKEAGMCAAAARALKAITGQDFGQDALRWQQWWEGHGQTKSQRPSDVPPAEVLPPGVLARTSLGRNDPCWCGSGKKIQELPPEG